MVGMTRMTRMTGMTRDKIRGLGVRFSFPGNSRQLNLLIKTVLISPSQSQIVGSVNLTPREVKKDQIALLTMK